jgi:hypothetical protein
MKDKIKLLDTSFSHSILGYCSDFQSSEYFFWDRSNINLNGNEDIVFTDSSLHMASKKEISNAWIIEPIEISPGVYSTIKNISSNFNRVFTHEKTLLDLGKPYELVPFGCCWIKPEDHKIYNKTKNLSIIASNKNYCEGHVLRQNIIKNFKDYMDIYGRGHNEIPYKIDGLKDYRFSIVIENCKRDYWFTEKLIDCLVTGTIPIYWGCPSINDFFDTKGFIIINNINDLENIINELSEEMYNSKLEYIKHNFIESQKYLLPDNLIYKKLKK